MRQFAATTAPRRARTTWLALLTAATLAALLLPASSSSRSGASSTPPAAETTAAAAAAPAFQGPRPWTAVGSTGVIDESSINFFAFGQTDLGFRLNSPGTVIVARYNVTNTFHGNPNENQPGWTTLQMGSFAPPNTVVRAELFRVGTCTPQPILLCTATNAGNNVCAQCTLNAPVDFTNNLFFVEVQIDRANSPAALPRMSTLRIF